ncbi:MAG: hypothetical protein IT371_16270 [Deltaproteobacteria bacterium]|nr:hypothetical protein [Deltaproteobacteria bacterium]
MRTPRLVMLLVLAGPLLGAGSLGARPRLHHRPSPSALAGPAVRAHRSVAPVLDREAFRLWAGLVWWLGAARVLDAEDSTDASPRPTATPPATPPVPPTLPPAPERACSVDADCTLIDPAEPCTCPPCGQAWRRPVHRAAARAWEQRRQRTLCAGLECCKSRVYGESARCVQGQCAVR